jgi:hypothetical protein
MSTELGKIASLIQGVEDTRTPLQDRLDHLGKILAAVAGGLVVVVFVTGLIRGEEVETLLLTSVSLAVAAIPEAMPAVVTIALSRARIGAMRPSTTRLPGSCSRSLTAISHLQFHRWFLAAYCELRAILAYSIHRVRWMM